MIRDQTKIYWEVIQEPMQTGAVRVVESPGPGGEQPNVCLVNYDKFCRAGNLEQRTATRLQTARLIAAAPQMLREFRKMLLQSSILIDEVTDVSSKDILEECLRKRLQLYYDITGERLIANFPPEEQKNENEL